MVQHKRGEKYLLGRLEIALKNNDEKVRITSFYGSLLHGLLMNNIEPEYAEKLHSDSLKPYSQFIYFDREKGTHIWRINTLTEEAREKILLPLPGVCGNNIHISNREVDLQVLSMEIIPSITYMDLTKKYFVEEEGGRRAVIRFLTPTTFKKEGQYTIFPDISNIYKSLYNKWNSFYSHVSLESEEVLQHLIDNTIMIGYKLRSTKYEMEKVRINSFRGEICLTVRGPAVLAAIARLLFAFGEYSGIGAKSAMGMGGIKVSMKSS